MTMTSRMMREEKDDLDHVDDLGYGVMLSINGDTKPVSTS